MATAFNPTAAPQSDAEIEREIDILLAKIEQGLADMKATRPAEEAQQKRLDHLDERRRAIQAETQNLLARLRENR